MPVFMRTCVYTYASLSLYIYIIADPAVGIWALCNREWDPPLLHLLDLYFSPCGGRDDSVQGLQRGDKLRRLRAHRKANAADHDVRLPNQMGAK